MSQPLSGRESGIARDAAACTVLEIDGVFSLQLGGGTSYFLEFDRSGNSDRPTVTANWLSPINERKALPGGPPVPVMLHAPYASEEGFIYLAFGTEQQDGYTNYVIATVATSKPGSMVELDRFTLGSEFCGGIFLTDLNNDGQLDLAVPYATGAGGGGGIEVRTIEQDGGLAWFGNDELDSTLFSQTGYINLLDHDGDGDWEIETMAPVLCSACGYAWNDLWTFDAESWNWETDEVKFAAYYKPQRDFYSALNTAVQKLAARPADLAYSGSAIESDYATQIGGQWYSLDVFIPDGKLDKTWVSQLAALVEGWQ